jgi:2-methylcitrate dehydratase
VVGLLLYSFKNAFMKTNQCYQMARFICNTSFEAIPEDIIEQLKRHLLDSMGSLTYSIDRPAVQKLINQIKNLGENGRCQAPVIGHIAADRAAQLFTAMIRYPDFMDNFFGKEATCHPCDNIGVLLAAFQLVNTSGRDFLTAMAIGYAMECRLVEELPVMIKGFDHTVLLAYSATAALCRLLQLTEEQTAHALAIAGCSLNPLVTCRVSYTYEWKGFASSQVALGSMQAVLLAQQGMTGPISLFEGEKGIPGIYGMELKYDWMQEDFSLIRKCILKRFNAEAHTQSILEAAEELMKEQPIAPGTISSMDVTTFLTAYHIVGGGEYGDRRQVHSKEQADHSLPYVLAVLLLDGKVYPEQLLPERIVKTDVQDLLKKVSVHTAFPLHKPVLVAGTLDPYTRAYPEKVKAKLEITLSDGKKYSKEKEDYYGFFTRPLSWQTIEEKFKTLSANQLSSALQQQWIAKIAGLENSSMQDLIELLCLR